MGEEHLAAAVDALLDDVVGSGQEVGVQVAVIRNGDTLVDTARGASDPRTGAPVDRNTLFWAGSTAKGVASSVAHVLIERGELTDDLRVADVWPEFGARGKDTVTLRHVLLHTAGVPGLPPETAAADLCDWDTMCAVIADAELWWEPGTRLGYHAKTFGFLLGEILRRATGDTISTLLRERLTGPLHVANDVHFGVPARLLSRVARQVAADRQELPRAEPGSPLDRAMPAGVVPDADYANRLELLTSDIPSEGTMSALGAARIYSALLGHVDGVELVSPARRAAMATVAFTGMDEVMGFPTEWAYGYSPARPSGRGKPGSAFGMVGMNGSAAYAGINSGVAVAVMRNRFTADFTHRADRSIDRGRTVVDQMRRGANRKGPLMNEPTTTLDDRFSDPGGAPTSWDETVRTLEEAELFWITTVRADGRPHMSPLVAVWLDDALHFSTGADEQKAVNLRANPHVLLMTGCNQWDRGLDVVVEGEAIQATDDTTLKRLADAWRSKWDGRWQFEARDGCFHHEASAALVFSVAPTKVLAFSKGTFTHTSHRF